MRLAHGYTNESWADEDGIHKHYIGIGTQTRMRTELDAMRAMAQRVPIPQVLAVNEGTSTVTLRRVIGRHGQELIDEGHAADVLRAAGQTLRRLHGSAADGTLVVHGDYGPQNLLFDPSTHEVVAVLDWEFSHQGEAIEDLAWAEWIVRMHHPAAVCELSALFDGYGERPPWADRQAVMISRCDGFRVAAEQTGEAGSEALWRERLAITTAWRE
jgi:aminoglycoside phosphotransferase (APT) family kinase protein